jgi:hypothetical protein
MTRRTPETGMRKVHFLLPIKLITALDAQGAARGMTRTAVVEEAVRDWLARAALRADADLPRDPLGAAVDAYRAAFGEGPPVWQFMGDIPALIRELRAAVARGEPLTDEDLYRRLGQTPPPTGACL